MLFYKLNIRYFTLGALLTQAHGSLYGVFFNASFVEIDRDTGTINRTIGVLDEDMNFNAGAVDSSGRLLSVDFRGNTVYEIDRLTASISPVVDIMGLAVDVRSIAIDSDGTLYVAGLSDYTDLSSGSLWTVDLVRGAAMSVGSLLGVNCQGMAFDNEDVLYCLDNNAGLFGLDTATGAPTHLAEFPSIATVLQPQTLEFDHTTGKMLAARYALFEINLTDYSITERGPIAYDRSIQGLFSDSHIDRNPIPCFCDRIRFPIIRRGCKRFFCV